MKNKDWIIRGKAAEFINALFQTILVTYLVLLLIEQIWVGSISFYINLNYLLFIVIILGVLDVFSEKLSHQKESIKRKDYLFIFLLGVLSFVIIKFKTSFFGWLSWVISIIASIIIILLSLLVLEEGLEEKEDRRIIKKKKITLKQKAFFCFLGVLFLLLVSFIISLFTPLSFLEVARIIFGSIYVLFLPGFIISYIFFPETMGLANITKKETEKDNEKVKNKKSNAIDWLERIGLSFALSIAIVPLVAFYLNLLKVKINILNVSLEIFGIITISLLILFIKNKKRKLKYYSKK